jgi:hypothetical protein
MFVGSNAIDRAAFAHWLGTGRHESFKGANLGIDDLHKLGLEPGQRVAVDGSVYRAVRARGAITGEGYILKSYFGAATRTGTVQATFSKTQIVTQETFVKGQFQTPKRRGRVFIDSGTGIGQLREILKNDTTTLTVAQKTHGLPQIAASSNPDALGTITDGTSTYSIVCDWEVEMTSGVTDLVGGVALGAVTDGNFTIIVEESPHVLFMVDGNDAGKTAAAAGALIVPSATAGVANPHTEAGITALEASRFFGQLYDIYTGAAALRHGRLFSRFAIG